MHEDLLKEQHLEAMRQWGNMQSPRMGNARYPGTRCNLPAYLEGRDRVTIPAICESLGIQYSRPEAIRIGKDLRARGWRPYLWRAEGRLVTGFHRPGYQRPRQVVKPAAPPPVGFWRRLLRLLTGEDR